MSLHFIKNISFDVSDQRCKKVFGASLSKFINFTHDHIEDLKLIDRVSKIGSFCNGSIASQSMNYIHLVKCKSTYGRESVV